MGRKYEKSEKRTRVFIYFFKKKNTPLLIENSRRLLTGSPHIRDNDRGGEHASVSNFTGGRGNPKRRDRRARETTLHRLSAASAAVAVLCDRRRRSRGGFQGLVVAVLRPRSNGTCGRVAETTRFRAQRPRKITALKIARSDGGVPVACHLPPPDASRRRKTSECGENLPSTIPVSRLIRLSGLAGGNKKTRYETTGRCKTRPFPAPHRRADGNRSKCPALRQPPSTLPPSH